MSYVTQFGIALYELWLEAAPWLLIGMIVAGLMKALVPASAMRRWLGGQGLWGRFSATVKAAIIGTPLPLCSCSVLPAAIALRRSGASKSATVSFLVSTPENGADSIAVTYALMGPFMTVVRPVAGVMSAIVAGVMVMFVKDDALDESTTQAGLPESDVQGTSCCGSKAELSEPVKSCCSSEPVVESASCCSSQESPKVESCCSSQAASSDSSCCGSSSAVAFDDLPLKNRLIEGMRYVFTQLLRDIAFWLFVGLLVAAAVQAFVPKELLAEWGSGPWAMLIMLVVGVPMYVCAVSSTPIAASLMVAGVHPGTVLVFLLAGPATNLGALAIIRREVGTAATVCYLVAIAVCSIGFGLLTMWIVDAWDINVLAQVDHAHRMIPLPIAVVSAIVLGALMVKPLLDSTVGFFTKRLSNSKPTPATNS